MSARPQILPGEKFFWLTVVRRLPFSTKGRSAVECRCECGSLTSVETGRLRSGYTKSCGCLRRIAWPRVMVHKERTRAPLYALWQGMKARCHRPTATSFNLYGGRGITVCARWRRSFAAFVVDVGLRPSPKHQLDRINNDGNYEPGNVRWATPREQAANRRKVRRLKP